MRIASRLKGLRQERGWSLDELAGRAGVSRATLSRLENAEVSPTASVLGRLCAAGLTMSRLMLMVEDDFAPLVPESAQPVWVDASAGFRRRSVSPPAAALAGEVLACELDAGARIEYPQPPRPNLEHHLLMLEGALHITVDGRRHGLRPGDCQATSWPEPAFRDAAGQRRPLPAFHRLNHNVYRGHARPSCLPCAWSRSARRNRNPAAGTGGAAARQHVRAPACFVLGQPGRRAGVLARQGAARRGRGGFACVAAWQDGRPGACSSIATPRPINRTAPRCALLVHPDARASRGP